jgi:hypothetical protein
MALYHRILVLKPEHRREEGRESLRWLEDAKKKKKRIL